MAWICFCFISKINTLQYGYNCLFFSVSDQKTEKYLESFTFSCWTWWVPSAGTGCYLNQERGTRNGCIAVIHIRIQVKNPFHKVLTNRPCYLLRRPSRKSACSKLVLRPFSSSRHPLFWILMGITGVNPFLVPRFPFPVSRIWNTVRFFNKRWAWRIGC